MPFLITPAKAPTHVITVDSSQYAWGATLSLASDVAHTPPRPPRLEVAQHWSSSMYPCHITRKEARASALAVLEFLPQLPPHSHVQIQSDSLSAVWAWRHGSSNLVINESIRDAATLLHRRNVTWESSHIPGSTNLRADWLSRHPDNHSYALLRPLFRYLVRHFAFPAQIDLFANHHNRQCPLYYSYRPDRRALGTDAFAQDWSKTLNWANPPFHLAMRFLQKVQRDKARVLAILPRWTSRPWWPLFVKLQACPPLLLSQKPMFRDPNNQLLPAPRWPLVAVVLDGSRGGPG